MMASGGRMKACVASALFCVGLVVFFVAQDAVGGQDAGADDANSSISVVAQQLAGAPNAEGDRASSGDLYVMTSREPDAAKAKQLAGEVAAEPKADAIKAGAVVEEELGPGAIEIARADAEEIAAAKAAAAEAHDTLVLAAEDTAPAATAGEESHSEAAMTEEDLRVATGQPQPKVQAAPVPAPAAVAPTPVVPQEPVILAETGGGEADVVVTPETAEENSRAGGMFDGAPHLAENPVVESTFAKSKSHDGIMRVLAGKSLILDLERTAKRVSVANPEVAEVLIISPEQVMVNGLKNGETSIIIWDNNGNYRMNTLVVGDQLSDQVMLDVTVAEINRSAAERHGVDVRATGGQFGTITQFGNTAPVGGSYPPRTGEPLFPFGLDSGVSWAVVDFKNDIAAFFEQIQKEDLGRILAEPKLLARSGKEANFLSGGEIPIVVTQQQNTTIEFKEFGTKIKFVPEVREDGTIDLKVQSEVSEPDFPNGVDLFGFRVPAFITRRVDTDVTLRSMESLVIAGLVKETKQEIESKLPFVGDIPYLGYLFRSTEFKKDLLELIIVVKPKIVGSIPEGASVPLPTDRGPLTREEVRTKAAKEKVTRPRPY
jgi:pilus assembly protein CpaC